MKLCCNCIYYRRDGFMAECTIAPEISPVDGTERAGSCYFLRANASACGPEGKWFTPHDPSESKVAA